MKKLIAILVMGSAAMAFAEHRPGGSFGPGGHGGIIPGNSYEVRRLADNVSYNAREAVSVAFRMGDRGPALEDLQNLSARADLFARSNAYSDFNELRLAFDLSRGRWSFLRAYRLDARSFNAMDLDMATLNSLMGVVIVQPPIIIQPPIVIHPPMVIDREITVTAQGSGGTEIGNIEGAKEKAFQRAIPLVMQACQAKPFGRVVGPVRKIGESCHKDSKKKGDYNCYVDVAVQCMVRF